MTYQADRQAKLREFAARWPPASSVARGTRETVKSLPPRRPRCTRCGWSIELCLCPRISRRTALLLALGASLFLWWWIYREFILLYRTLDAFILPWVR